MFRANGYSELIYGFQLALEVSGLRHTTIKHYTTDARKFLEYFPDRSLSDISPSDIREYLSTVRKRVSAKTVYENQLALRKFFKFLTEDGEIENNPCAGIKLTRYRVVPQPIYSSEEVGILLAHCNLKTLSGVRDYAIITVLFDTGVRAGELISMAPPDWKNRLTKVDGKTGIRYVPLGLTSLQALQRYTRKWEISTEPLWIGKYGPLTTSGVLQMVRRVCKRSQVPFKGVHAFRRSAAAQMKRIGMNDSDIMEIMGWTEVTMLRRYVSAVSLELAQSAHRKFSPADSIISRYS